MSKSKEEILDELLPHDFYTPVYPKNSKPIHEDNCKRCIDEEIIFKAMDEYAKQEAIEFCKWAIQNGYRINNTYISKWYRIRKRQSERLTTEKLYDLFVEQKTNRHE